MGARRWLVLGLAAAACVPSPGPFRLAEVDGRVLDSESGAPLAGAEVIQWYRGAGLGGGPQPVYHARWTTTDEHGAFHFPSTVAPSPRMWVLKTYDPIYAFFHPRYGLQRSTTLAGGQVVLRGSLARAPQALADLRPYCRGEIDDAGARRLAEIACPARPRRPEGDVRGG